MPFAHSDSPFTCIISTSRSIRARTCIWRTCSSRDLRFQVVSKRRPFDTLALCGIVMTSQPVPAFVQSASSRSQRSIASGASSEEIGSSGTLAFRKITFRWTFDMLTE